MFFRFELSFDLLTSVNGLDNGINLSAEITESVSYHICWFLNLVSFAHFLITNRLILYVLCKEKLGVENWLGLNRLIKCCYSFADAL